MKILIVTQYFWPEDFQINEVVLALKARGHETSVMTGKPNYPEGEFFPGYSFLGNKEEIWNDVKIYRIPMLARGDKSSLKLIFNYLSFIFFGVLFSPFILKRKSFDIIFVYAPSPVFQVIPASFIGWFKNIPVVLWVQDLWPQSAEATGHIKSKCLLNLIEKFVRFCYLHVDLILVQSKGFVKPVLNLVPGHNVIYHPNSVSRSFFFPTEIKIPEISSLESGFTILFAGNVGSAQSIETIMLAAKKVLSFTDIKIVIIGTGSKIEWLANQIKKNKITNIYLEGRHPVETMPLLMRKASVLLVSLTNQKIFNVTIPNKLQAYLAVGKPIIASMNGEGAEIVREAKAGLSVAAENPSELADAIIKLYKMTSHERAIMGENARIYYKENFDQEMLTDKLIGYLTSVVYKWSLKK